jgi:abortive infection bacteriophage resistance protein
MIIKTLPLHSIRPATPLLASAPGQVIFFMNYTKPPLTITDQIKALENRGMVFVDKIVAEHYLSNISYYRLRAYTFPYQNNSLPNHPFWRPTTFERVISDYVLDRKLRIIVFDALEKIEISLRTQIIYEYSIVFGSQWYENPVHYTKNHLFLKDLEHLEKEVKRSQEEFIKHYRKKYTNPINPPAWMALEVSTLGTLSKLYENLKPTREKKKIAKHYGLGHHSVLESWMKTFSHIRNICAHHSRLWNRPITIIPVIPTVHNGPWIDSGYLIEPHNIFTSLCFIRFVLNKISPNNNFNIKIQDLLNQFPTANLKTMGFLPDWEKEPLWK